MAAAFALVLRNQTLKLAFKSLLFALIVFWSREAGGFWPGLILLCFFAYNYFRPLAQSGRFLVAFLTISSLPFIFPTLESWNNIYFSLFIGALAYALIGIKDLLFVKRKLICQFLYFMILGAVIYLYIADPTVINQVTVFILSILLLRELYGFITDWQRSRILLTSLVYSLLVLEFGWATSLLPTRQLVRAALIAAILFITHDLTLNYASRNLSKRLIVRNLIVFLILIILVSASSDWNLS